MPAGPETAVEASARAVVETPLSLLEPYFDKATLCLRDFFSCAFEAADLPWSRQAERVAETSAQGATIIGSSKRAVAGDAAFANAVFGHGLVREDMHPGSISHLGVVVWPALLAASETWKFTGRDLFAGAVAGYEMGGRLGRSLITAEVARLFRPTGLVGPLAAAAAIARAIGLPIGTAASAMALAANSSSGLNQWPHHGADEMYFHPGFAVRNALTCVRLAEAGVWASPAIIEGEGGLLAAFGRMRDVAMPSLFPEGSAEIATVFNKDVPACNFAQSPAQAALAALQDARQPAGNIAEVVIETCDAALNYPGCAATGPFPTPLAAKMSIAFGVAAALDAGEIAEKNYVRLTDAGIARTIGVTRFEIAEEFNAAFPARQGARVTLRFKDGTEAACAQDDIRFATSQTIERRFRHHGSQRLGRSRAAHLEDAIGALSTLEDAGNVSRLGGIEAD